MTYAQIYQALLDSVDVPVVLNKSELPKRLVDCTLATLSLLFTTPSYQLRGHETSDTWVLWLHGTENVQASE